MSSIKLAPQIGNKNPFQIVPYTLGGKNFVSGRPGGGSVTSGSLLFRSTWETDTGTSENAVRDGMIWDGPHDGGGGNDGGTVLEVVGPTGLDGDDWTGTGNVLKVYEQGNDFVIAVTNVLPAATTNYGRCYMMFGETGVRDHNQHPCCYDLVGAIGVIWAKFGGITPPAGKIRAGISDGIEAWLHNGSDYIWLDRGVWYRWEWQLEYVTSTSVRLWPRIYNMAGTLLYDSDDMRQEDNWSVTLTAWYGSNTIWDAGATWTEIGLGNPSSLTSGPVWYAADFALSLTDWVGA